MMMRKRLLYWLAAFYLFVVQVVIVAHLWQESRLYILAGINFLVLIFFSVLFGLANKKQKSRSKTHDHKTTHKKNKIGSFKKTLYYFFQHYLFSIVLVLLPVLAAIKLFFGRSLFSIRRLVLVFVMLFVILLKAIVQKKIFFINKQLNTRSILFVLSVFVFFLLYTLVKNSGVEFRLAIVLSILLAFVLFVLSIKLFKARRMQKLISFWSIRLYLFALILSVIIFVLGGYLDLARQEKYTDEQPWVYKTWENIVDKVDDIFSNTEDTTKLTIVSGLDIETVDLPLEDSVLSTGVGQVLTSSFTGETMDETLIETGENSASVVLEPIGASLRNAEDYAIDDPLKYIDVIVYLLEDTQTALADDNYKLSFTYMSKTNEDYIYFKTAFYKKLIGKALKPSAKVKCDNYLVMKGILEDRDVSDQTGDIFAQYFAEAEELGVLHGCEKGAYLVKENL